MSATTCRRCGRGNDDGDRFCRGCGQALLAAGSPAPAVAHGPGADLHCARCGSPNEAFYRFCIQCGTAMAIAYERERGQMPGLDDRVMHRCTSCHSHRVGEAPFCAYCGAAYPRETKAARELLLAVQKMVVVEGKGSGMGYGRLHDVRPELAIPHAFGGQTWARIRGGEGDEPPVVVDLVGVDDGEDDPPVTSTLVNLARFIKREQDPLDVERQLQIEAFAGDLARRARVRLLKATGMGQTYRVLLGLPTLPEPGPLLAWVQQLGTFLRDIAR